MNNKIDSSYLSPIVVFVIMVTVGVVLMVVGILSYYEKKEMAGVPEIPTIKWKTHTGSVPRNYTIHYNYVMIGGDCFIATPSTHYNVQLARASKHNCE